MVAELKKKANSILIIGFVTWFGGNIMRYALSSPSIFVYLGYLVTAAGYLTFVYGCTIYSRAKGYHWSIGLLGLLSLIGLIILVLLPDKQKGDKAESIDTSQPTSQATGQNMTLNVKQPEQDTTSAEKVN